MRIPALVFFATLLSVTPVVSQHASHFGPTIRRKVDPEFTADARQAHIQGTVLLYMKVGTDGRAHDIRVIRGLGHGLDEKAMECLAKWEFQPALKDGEPVAVAATVEINFRLD